LEEEIMSEYITDPELLKQLNEGVQTPSTAPAQSEYVTDPELLKQLGTPEQPLQAPVNPTDYAMGQAAISGARPAAQTAYSLTGGIRDLTNVGKNLAAISPEGAKEILSSPLQAAKAYVQGHPFVQGGVGGAARGIGSALTAPLTAPENLFTLPYTMSAYEQEKIRQNPNAAGLESNPYAQTVRGEAKTQGSAGEANRMKATAEMPYGNVTPEEKRLLDEDRMMRQNIRKKAYEKVMGPIAPGSF
jgi:hypothetical protein